MCLLVLYVYMCGMRERERERVQKQAIHVFFIEQSIHCNAIERKKKILSNVKIRKKMSQNKMQKELYNILDTKQIPKSGKLK